MKTVMTRVSPQTMTSTDNPLKIAFVGWGGGSFYLKDPCAIIKVNQPSGQYGRRLQAKHFSGVQIGLWAWLQEKQGGLAIDNSQI